MNDRGKASSLSSANSFRYEIRKVQNDELPCKIIKMKMILVLNFRAIILTVLSAVSVLCSVNLVAQPKNKIITGAEQIDVLLPLIKEKKVALLVNNTSIINKTHLADSLISLKVDVKKIFSPEHGFRGNAPDGMEINDSIDSATKLPVVSLYGKNRKARPDQLADVDVVIYDIQDVWTGAGHGTEIFCRNASHSNRLRLDPGRIGNYDQW